MNKLTLIAVALLSLNGCSMMSEDEAPQPKAASAAGSGGNAGHAAGMAGQTNSYGNAGHGGMVTGGHANVAGSSGSAGQAGSAGKSGAAGSSGMSGAAGAGGSHVAGSSGASGASSGAAGANAGTAGSNAAGTSGLTPCAPSVDVGSPCTVDAYTCLTSTSTLVECVCGSFVPMSLAGSISCGSSGASGSSGAAGSAGASSGAAGVAGSSGMAGAAGDSGAGMAGSSGTGGSSTGGNAGTGGSANSMCPGGIWPDLDCCWNLVCPEGSQPYGSCDGPSDTNFCGCVMAAGDVCPIGFCEYTCDAASQCSAGVFKPWCPQGQSCTAANHSNECSSVDIGGTGGAGGSSGSSGGSSGAAGTSGSSGSAGSDAAPGTLTITVGSPLPGNHTFTAYGFSSDNAVTWGNPTYQNSGTQLIMNVTLNANTTFQMNGNLDNDWNLAFCQNGAIAVPIWASWNGAPTYAKVVSANGGCQLVWTASAATTTSDDMDGDGYTIANGDCNDNANGGQAFNPGMIESFGDNLNLDCDSHNWIDPDTAIVTMTGTPGGYALVLVPDNGAAAFPMSQLSGNQYQATNIAQPLLPSDFVIRSQDSSWWATGQEWNGGPCVSNVGSVTASSNHYGTIIATFTYHQNAYGCSWYAPGGFVWPKGQ